MEFVRFDEVADLLDDYGIELVPDGSDRVYLRMSGAPSAVHFHLACPQTKSSPRKGATIIPIEKQQLHKSLEHVVRLLHLDQVLLIPVGKWRKVFDAVAFSLAENEDWREMDATATVELNTRDPLLCEPADYSTLFELIGALLRDAETPDQGLNFVATASPVLVELIPDGAVRLSLGSQVLADEITDVFATGRRKA